MRMKLSCARNSQLKSYKFNLVRVKLSRACSGKLHAHASVQDFFKQRTCEHNSEIYFQVHIWAFFVEVLPHLFFQIKPPTGRFCVFLALKKQTNEARHRACTGSIGQNTILYMFLYLKYFFRIFELILVQIWELLKNYLSPHFCKWQGSNLKI